MLKRFLAGLLLLLGASPASAWWEYGHETVAQIAETSISAETRRKMAALIAASPELETPTCPLLSLEDASVWPDCIRGLRERFSYTSPWHYQNVDICRPFDQAGACRDGNCVSAQIERNAKLLADTELPRRERLMALSFLIHFVGDLHMPLHAGDRGDKGGNEQPAAYGLIAGRANLHSVWDGYLAERAISTPVGEAAGLLAGASAAERATHSGGSVADWARESWQLSRDAAYGTAMPDPCGERPERAMIDEPTTRRLIPVVRGQILRAGLRLARLLDEALG